MKIWEIGCNVKKETGSEIHVKLDVYPITLIYNDDSESVSYNMQIAVDAICLVMWNQFHYCVLCNAS